MKCKIEIDDCLRDSPKFRQILEEEELSIDQLEQKLDKILKTCGSMIDTGKLYVAQKSLFANSLWDLSLHYRDDPAVLSSLNKLIHSLQEMNKFHTTLLDQASRIVLKNMTSFIKNDIKQVKDSKSHFEKMSAELDNVLLRNSQTPKSKPNDVEEVENMLTATRSCFKYQSLDYVNSISKLQVRKRHEILDTLLSYMKACSTYYHQGSDLCEDLESFFKTLGYEISEMVDETSKVQKQLDNRHSIVTNKENVSPQSSVLRGSPLMEGYLFKRTSNAFKTWHRRWFCLNDNKLVYRKRTGEENVTVMEDDLRICTVKQVLDGERRFCFEVLSPLKSHMLQADSKEMYEVWISALQRGIGHAIQRVSSIDSEESHSQFNPNSSSNRQSIDVLSVSSEKVRKVRIWEQLVKIPGNNECCDCKSPNPRWASINLGITLCIECSGVHRSLGVHYSKVRSLTLDAWEPEIIKVMAELGNTIVNRVYEANVPSDITRAAQDCTGIVRESWIKSKYAERKFVKTLLQQYMQPSVTVAVTPPSTSTTPNSTPHSARASRTASLTVRKWSVRKLRRRPRSTDAGNRRRKVGGAKNQREKRFPSVGGLLSSDAARVDEQMGSGVNVKGAGDDDGKAEQNVKQKTPAKRRDSVLMFGGDLDKQVALDSLGPLELCSDDDSTGGEDEDQIDEEDISNLNPDILLYKAAIAHNLPVMCEALALGADKNWINVNNDCRSPIHQAVLSGSVMSCAYLIANGIKLNAQDNKGLTPLHLATLEGHTAQVCLLLKHRADQHIEDEDGLVPLTIAEQKEHADIVTLLRLGRLNDEMKETDQGINGDDTFNDVVRDFSQLACTHPERLQRKSENDST